MSRRMTRKEKVLELFKPDQNGKSDWVSIDSVIAADIGWTKNGNLRRGIAFGLDEYHWETERRSGPRSEVTALRMVGFNQDESFKQTISANVKLHFTTVLHCNFSLLPIPPQDREIDHRYGHKNHPDYIEIYKSKEQKKEHFQLIHRSLNLQKREMCKQCVETNRRPEHPELGFVQGDASHSDRFPCSGCYLAEPERYRK
jgi:hypothetical protein